MEGGSVLTKGAAQAPRLTILADLVADLVSDAETAHSHHLTGRPRGPVTSLGSLDEALGGSLAPGVHILQAAPGAGKTAICLQVAASCQFPALYVTAEMPPLELFRRIIARVTGTFLGRLKSGEMHPSRVETLAHDAARLVPTLAIMDGRMGFASPSVIAEAADALRARFEAQSLLVVVDAIQPWARAAPDRERTEYELVTAGVKAAGELATVLASPVLCVSHRNRVGNKGKDAGGMHAGKGSGDLEYAAETLIELTPGAQVDTNTREVTLAVHKNRHGTSDVEIPLHFEGRLQKFTEAC